MIATKIQLKTDTIANWSLNENALLLNGEAAVVQFPDGSSKIKIGDGVTVFKDLPYTTSDGFSVKISEDGGKTFLSASEFYYINISEKDYNELVYNGNVLSNAIYEVDYENANFYGERLTNVGEPELSSDAATKNYVDTEIQKIDVSGQLTGYALKNNISVLYDNASKKIKLNADGYVTEIDATDFIKDGMIDSAQYDVETKQVVLTFNTDAGKTPISVDLESLIDVYTAGTGLSVENNQFFIDEDVVATKEYVDSIFTFEEINLTEQD